MTWLKLTSKALYLMDAGEYLEKVDLIPTDKPNQFKMNLPLEQLRGTSTPGKVVVSLKSPTEPTKKVVPTPPKPTRNEIRITKTGKQDANGLVILKVALINTSGTEIESISAVSGAAGCQVFRLPSASISGSCEPLPQGRWKLGPVEFASGIKNNLSEDWPEKGDGVGPVWVSMTCQSMTDRSAIGFHIDNNSHSAPGTVGCVGIPNEPALASLKKFVKWFEIPATAPHFAVVDWGL